MFFWWELIGHVCISGHVFLQLSPSSNHLTSILHENSSWQTDMRTHLLKSVASGPLKIEKGAHPVLILATHHHTTESVAKNLPRWDFGPYIKHTSAERTWISSDRYSGIISFHKKASVKLLKRQIELFIDCFPTFLLCSQTTSPTCSNEFLIKRENPAMKHRYLHSTVFSPRTCTYTLPQKKRNFSRSSIPVAHGSGSVTPGHFLLWPYSWSQLPKDPINHIDHDTGSLTLTQGL